MADYSVTNEKNLNFWNIDPDAETLAYHLKQHDEPKRSTVHFAEFCRRWLESSKMVYDLGCGAGGPTAYLAQSFPNCYFLGFDISEKLITFARAHNHDNLNFAVGNLENLGIAVERTAGSALSSLQVALLKIAIQ